MRSLRPLGLGVVLCLTPMAAAPLSAQGPPQGPEGDVVAVAERFLAALSSADTATLSGLLADGATIHSVREGGGGTVLRVVSRESFLESLGGESQLLLERMWNPTVLVQGRVAVVWTPYDFHLNGEFSHCGVDIFTLLKGERGWQVTGITYNVVRDGCPPSPLGPPGGKEGGREG